MYKSVIFIVVSNMPSKKIYIYTHEYFFFYLVYDFVPFE